VKGEKVIHPKRKVGGAPVHLGHEKKGLWYGGIPKKVKKKALGKRGTGGKKIWEQWAGWKRKKGCRSGPHTRTPVEAVLQEDKGGKKCMKGKGG